jgi:hypothetical protein
MWIFSSVGFFSVVEKPQDRDTGTFPNFKNAITVQQGHHRANIYSKVWTVLLPLEDEK